jgi:DNA invertase Pin-like site-specific DNA recombinase
VEYAKFPRNDLPSRGLRAAQYVRMSTERQRYSTENQAAAIATYAAQRNLKIVRTYVDKGRSGLRIKGRDGLHELISDVRGGSADFDVILVYDVSRWGRFQDADESAYYEFVCKEAGIKVLYCAEQFDNDASLMSSIVKNLKRVMAGEFSRELSEKVFLGSCRTVQLGFKQGGSPGYGLQRVLVDENRSPKCLLGPGEWKSLQTDRVILQPGQAHEVETVRRIFHSFVVDRKSELAIVRDLNDQLVLNEFGRPWRRNAIHRLLTSEKYIGNYLYNRCSSKLKQRKTRNPPEIWVRCDHAFDGIVEPAIFDAAKRIISTRPRCTTHAWPSNEDILARLSSLLKQKGRLTCKIIDEADSLPCSAVYSARFGGMSQAYELVGYDAGVCKRSEGKRAVIATITKLGVDIAAKVESAGGSADFDKGAGVLTINNALTVSIFVARCQRMRTGSLRWKIRRRIDLTSDLIVVARMDEGNKRVLDYVLVPPNEMPDGKISFWKKDRAKIDPYRLNTLDELVAPIWRALIAKMSALPGLVGSAEKPKLVVPPSSAPLQRT